MPYARYILAEVVALEKSIDEIGGNLR